MSIYIYVASTGVVIVVMNVAPHVFCVTLHTYISLSINREMIILQLYSVI